MSILIAPNGLTTAHRPIIWRAQLDATIFPNVSFARAVVKVNGNEVARLIAKPYLDPAYPTFYNFRFDVSGILLQSFFNPQKPTDTLNYEFGYQVAYFQYSLDTLLKVYLEIEYISINALNQEVIETDEDTIEIAVLDAKVQPQERTDLAPYRFALGMKPLTYVRYGSIPGDDGNMPTLEYSAHGAYLSFLFDGGVGVPFVSFQLRDAVPGSGGNYYGTGLARLSPPSQFRNVVTVSIAPQNILNFIFDQVTTGTFDFIANLNNPAAGWDRIGVAFGMAIPLGGGNYQYITYSVSFYKVSFVGCDTLALYCKNTLGAFDTMLFNKTETRRSIEVASAKGILPQKFDTETLGLTERYRANYRSTFRYSQSVDASIRLVAPAYTNLIEARVLWQLLQTSEAFMEEDGLAEYQDPTNLEPNRFLPVTVEDSGIISENEYHQLVISEIIVKPANAYY